MFRLRGGVGPLAICAAQRIRQGGFEEVVREAIEAGGDTDTIASITGEIAGSWGELSGIPSGLVRRLPEGEEILKTARSFASLVAAAAGRLQ
jgi:ADP-ribosylglycohydrolase